AQIEIILEQPVQPRLLEDHAVVNTLGTPLTASLGVTKDRLMIGLRPARQRGEQVVPNDAQVKLVQAAALLWIEIPGQAAIAQADLGEAVEVEVGYLGIGPTQAAVFSFEQGVVSGNEMVVDGVAEVRQIQAPEGSVPPRAVALGPV